MNDKTISILRWIAVLPVAFLSMVIVRYVVELVGKVINYDMVTAVESTDGWGGFYLYGPVYLTVRQIIGTTFFVLFGCLVAPSRHRAASIALAILLGCILVSGVVVMVIVRHKNGTLSTESIVRDAVFLLSSAVGIFYALNVFNENEGPQEI